jgi:hypothetical protein
MKKDVYWKEEESRRSLEIMSTPANSRAINPNNPKHATDIQYSFAFISSPVTIANRNRNEIDRVISLNCRNVYESQFLDQNKALES